MKNVARDKTPAFVTYNSIEDFRKSQKKGGKSVGKKQGK